MFASDGRTRASCHRGQASVSGKVGGGSKCPTGYIDQEPCRGPDADSRHAGQDRMKRVCKDETLDFFCNFLTLVSQRLQLLCQARQDDGRGLSAQNDDCLLRERLNDLSGPQLTHSWRQLEKFVCELFLAQYSKLRRRRIPLVRSWSRSSMAG